MAAPLLRHPAWPTGSAKDPAANVRERVAIDRMSMPRGCVGAFPLNSAHQLGNVARPSFPLERTNGQARIVNNDLFFTANTTAVRLHNAMLGIGSSGLDVDVTCFMVFDNRLDAKVTQDLGLWTATTSPQNADDNYLYINNAAAATSGQLSAFSENDSSPENLLFIDSQEPSVERLEFNSAAFTYNATTNASKIYLDGGAAVGGAEASETQAFSTPSNPADYTYLFSLLSGRKQFEGLARLVLFFDRPLMDHEIAWLHLNPWGGFKPAIAPVYFLGDPPVSDSTAPTYSAAPAISAGPTQTTASVSSTAADETSATVEKAYVLLAGGAAAPADGEDVFNLTGNAASPIASGSLTGGSAVANGVESTFDLTSMSIGTQQDYYEALHDGAGNYTLSAKVDLDTQSAISASLTDGTLTPGQATPGTTSGLGAITTAIVVETNENVFSRLSSIAVGSFTFTAPPDSQFAENQPHDNLQWGVNYTLRVGDGTDTADITFQIVPIDSDGPTNWFLTAPAGPYPNDSIFRGYTPETAVDDEFRIEVVSGTINSISPLGVVNFVPGQSGSARVSRWDASSNVWGILDTATWGPPAAAPTWSPVPAQQMTLNEAFSLDLSVYTDPDGESYSLITGSLPTGVTLSGSVVSGTPTEYVPSFNATFRATRTSGSGDSNSVAFTMVAVPLFDGSVPDQSISAGQLYSLDLDAYLLNGPADSWAIASGTLPAGLSLAFGVVSGTPTGTFLGDVTFTATNAQGSTDSNTVSFALSSSPIFIGSIPLQSYTVGSPVSVNLDGFLQNGPATLWEVVAGALPAGLSVSGNLIVGTPTVQQSGSIVIRATNALGTTDSDLIFFSVTAEDLLSLVFPNQLGAAADSSNVTSALATVTGSAAAQDLALQDLDGGSAEYNYNSGGWVAIGAGVTIPNVDAGDTLQLRLDTGPDTGRDYRISGTFLLGGNGFRWLVAVAGAATQDDSPTADDNRASTARRTIRSRDIDEQVITDEEAIQ